MRLILASASPRRAELLRAAGFEFDLLTVDIDERVRPGETPADYVQRLAGEKSARAMEQFADRRSRKSVEQLSEEPNVAVLGADTSVVVDDAILGKPSDEADAKRMLRRLSGRAHTVLTGVSIRWSRLSPAAGPAEVGFVASTAVYFDELGDEEIDWYVQTKEGFDKAGGYAVQGLASRFVQRIDGSYSNVVGLPVAAVYKIFRTP